MTFGRHRLAQRATALARALALLAVGILGWASPSQARSLADAEKADLEKVVAEFNVAMRDGNFDRVVETIPPKLLGSISTKSGVAVDQIRKSMIDLMQSMKKQAVIESFSMDLAQSQYRELSNGTPYVLIPTTTIVAAGDKGRFREKTHSLALIDDGKWFLVRISDMQQLALVKDVYPDFAGVEFPQGSTEILKK